ncbi:MAG TPA: hypothetical protein VGM82_03945 [Gemmatimonadaceae bacterium]|jgi:hypothetical protein
MPDNTNDDLANLSDREAPLAPRQAEPANPAPRLADVSDPADEIPVPAMMEPAEIDERAQAVEAVRGTDRVGLEPRTDV